MNKKVVVERCESAIKNNIRPTLERATVHCKDCDCKYGDAECKGCFYYDVINAIQSCETLIGSILLDIKLNNLR